MSGNEILGCGSAAGWGSPSSTTASRPSARISSTPSPWAFGVVARITSWIFIRLDRSGRKRERGRGRTANAARVGSHTRCPRLSPRPESPCRPLRAHRLSALGRKHFGRARCLRPLPPCWQTGQQAEGCEIGIGQKEHHFYPATRHGQNRMHGGSRNPANGRRRDCETDLFNTRNSRWIGQGASRRSR